MLMVRLVQGIQAGLLLIANTAGPMISQIISKQFLLMYVFTC